MWIVRPSARARLATSDHSLTEFMSQTFLSCNLVHSFSRASQHDPDFNLGFWAISVLVTGLATQASANKVFWTFFTLCLWTVGSHGIATMGTFRRWPRTGFFLVLLWALMHGTPGVLRPSKVDIMRSMCCVACVHSTSPS